MLLKKFIINLLTSPIETKQIFVRMSSLKNVLCKLEEIAPISLAEDWDNVGLLIEPATPTNIDKIFLTNDLTESVLKEAIDKNANLIISYHPPIFAPLKRITQRTWKERIVAVCLENKIALYSPHTSWDSAKNGVNDWLADCFPYEICTPILKKQDNPDVGAGRFLTLNKSISLKNAIEKIKTHTGLPNVQVALGQNSSDEQQIKTIALCAGSGASVLKGIRADLYLTGELSHHEVLDATQRNISVILTNHSNSERGYLKIFRQVLKANISNSVEILISKNDVDPLSTF